MLQIKIHTKFGSIQQNTCCWVNYEIVKFHATSKRYSAKINPKLINKSFPYVFSFVWFPIPFFVRFHFLPSLCADLYLLFFMWESNRSMAGGVTSWALCPIVLLRYICPYFDDDGNHFSHFVCIISLLYNSTKKLHKPLNFISQLLNCFSIWVVQNSVAFWGRVMDSTTKLGRL